MLQNNLTAEFTERFFIDTGKKPKKLCVLCGLFFGKYV